MPNVDWKSLEGKPWKLDVGSSMAEALQSKDNSTLHVTTDGQIVMNGEPMCARPYFHIPDVDKLFYLNGKVSDDELKEALTFKTPNNEEINIYEDFIIFLYYVKSYGLGIIDDDCNNTINVSIGYENSSSIVQFTMISPSYGSPRISYLVIDSNTGVCYSKKNASFINSSKVSEPDFEVCVRKALPMYPRKGMKYYFDNGVKYNLPKKAAFDNGFTFTVPKDGNTWVVCGFKGDKSDKIVPNGTVIDKNNLLKYFPSAGEVEGIYTVITRKTNEPVLITIVKDMESVFKKGTFKEACAPRISCDCRKKYRRIVDGKVRYDIPIPDLRKGESVFDSKYAIFKYRWKRVKYYGENPPEGMKLNDRKTIIIDGKEKKSYRMIRSDRKGTVYVARQIPLRKVGRKGRHRYILSPKVKCFVDENLKIIKRL